MLRLNEEASTDQTKGCSRNKEGLKIIYWLQLCKRYCELVTVPDNSEFEN